MRATGSYLFPRRGIFGEWIFHRKTVPILISRRIIFAFLHFNEVAGEAHLILALSIVYDGVESVVVVLVAGEDQELFGGIMILYLLAVH